MRRQVALAAAKKVFNSFVENFVEKAIRERLDRDKQGG
jgi:hypothetical protein